MLRFDEIVFGPIHSRRLGSSLGINLLPQHGKLCNFDCIYCECGWNREGRTNETLPGADAIAEALEQKLVALKASGERLDSITFSGHGEPTLHPEFASIVDVTVELRDKYFPGVQVSVLSNATMLGKSEIVQALKKVDNPILKLDAPDTAGAAYINRPQGKYDVDAVVAGMKQFEGNFILQTMMLHSDGLDFSADAHAFEAWKSIVRDLRPRMVMVYSLDRPSPQQGLVKMSVEDMSVMLADLMNEGINIKIY